MATIRDVAREAGVSIGTVSNVLNGLASVTEGNRQKVLHAVEKLGFKKSYAASLLRAKTSRSVGLVIPDITNPFYPEIARGVEDMASASGYTLVLCNFDRSRGKEEAALEVLLAQDIAGIILVKTCLSHERLAAIRRRCALVLMDAPPGIADCDCVNVDDDEGIRGAVHQICVMGHTRLGFVGGRTDSYSSQRRVTTFTETMQSLSIPIHEGYLVRGDYSMESGRRAVEQMMSLPQPPTVILCANDMMAIGVLLRAIEMGFRIPKDLSIVGYDDSQVVKYVRPELTTVWHPKYEFGQMGAEFLLRRIKARQEGSKLSWQTVRMSTKFIRRETLAAPRSTTHAIHALLP